jgi:hypothetical protein
MRMSIKVGALASGAALTLIGTAMSCGSTHSVSSTGGPEAPLDAASTTDAAGAERDSEAGGPSDQDATGPDVGNQIDGGGTTDSGTWSPSGDPAWKSVSWANGCKMEVATAPKHAVAPLEWVPCGADWPGCQRLVRNWPSTYNPVLLPQSASFARQGTMIRVSMAMSYDKDSGPGSEWRVGMFDQTMQPIAAWRAQAQGCGGLPRWTPKHVCFPLTSSSTGMHEVILSPTDPASDPLAIYDSSNVVLGNACDDDLLGGFGGGVGGTTAYVRDLVNGNEYALTPPTLGETYDPALVGPRALTLHWWSDSQGEHIDGWIWQRPNSFARLVSDPGGMLYDLRSDGITLVWIQTGSKSAYDLASGEIWTSPFDPDPANLQPAFRRATPTVGLSPTAKVIGSGYYGIIEQVDGSRAWKAHVYRLSDMRHWEVSTPPDVAASDMIAIDDQEVWFFGQTPTVTNNYQNTIIRQRLADLGAGD